MEDHILSRMLLHSTLVGHVSTLQSSHCHLLLFFSSEMCPENPEFSRFGDNQGFFYEPTPMDALEAREFCRANHSGSDLAMVKTLQDMADISMAIGQLAGGSSKALNQQKAILELQTINILILPN